MSAHPSSRGPLMDDTAAEQAQRADPRDNQGTGDGDKTVLSTGELLEADFLGLPPRELGHLLVGQSLDQFELEQFIGGGGMGAVFRANDTSLHRTVAVKVLAAQSAAPQDIERRFELEARSAARLDHPNIARVHYVGQDRGLHYIVFEYIEGTNIRDLVYQAGPLPLADALNYTLQIADALIHAWQREVVHRDVKPSNILITPDGQAKLVDMGLARLHQLDHSGHDLTASGVTLGTFDYISPEQARDPRSADIRSDIYSLGCTLFFMLAGRPPFPEGTVLQKLLQHQGDDPPDLQEIRPDTPGPVVEVANTMLAKKPGDRFQTPAELVTALVAVTEQLGLSHPAVVSPLTWTEPTLRGHWVVRNAPWLVPAILLPLGVLAMERFWRSDDPPPQFSDLQRPVLAAPQEPAPAAETPSLNDESESNELGGPKSP